MGGTAASVWVFPLPDQYEGQYDALISTTNDASRISELHAG